MAADSGNQDGKHIAHQIGNMLLYMQIHIPFWSDLNQFHHPQTDKLKTACNLSDMRTAPLPREFKKKEDYQKNNLFPLGGKKGQKENTVSRVYYKMSNKSL